MNSNAMDILIKPIITEKATNISELNNCYSFLVNTKANKVEIKKAVEAAYGVSVESVNTMNYAGKAKSRFTKAGLIKGRTNKYKKAIIKHIQNTLGCLHWNIIDGDSDGGGKLFYRDEVTDFDSDYIFWAPYRRLAAQIYENEKKMKNEK